MIELDNVLMDTLQKVKGFIFDCDGVLFDSQLASLLYINEHLVQLSLNPLPLDDPKNDYLFALTLEDILKELAPNASNNQIRHVMEKVRYDGFIQYMRPAGNMQEMLSYLKNSGYYLSVMSNRDSSLSVIVEHYKLDNYLKPIITTEVVKPKPDPEGLLLILKKWNLKNDEVVFIGDSPSDEKAASNAGIAFWAFNNKKLNASLILPDFKTLIEIISLFNSYNDKRK